MNVAVELNASLTPRELGRVHRAPHRGVQIRAERPVKTPPLGGVSKLWGSHAGRGGLRKPRAPLGTARTSSWSRPCNRARTLLQSLPLCETCRFRAIFSYSHNNPPCKSVWGKVEGHSLCMSSIRRLLGPAQGPPLQQRVVAAANLCESPDGRD